MNENKKDKKIEVIFWTEKIILSELTIFFMPNIETAAKVGTDSKKEILAESILLKLSNLAAVMVMPDLLTPGTKEKTWKKPIIKAVLKEKFFSIFLFKLNLSLINNKIPNIMVVHATISTFLIFSIKFVSTKIIPLSITGIEDITILKNRTLFA